jgi:hypothetical protein
MEHATLHSSDALQGHITYTNQRQRLKTVFPAQVACIAKVGPISYQQGIAVLAGIVQGMPLSPEIMVTVGDAQRDSSVQKVNNLLLLSHEF